MTIEVTVGDLVRQAREERDWSQFELGERIGMSQRTISRIETNKYTTSLRSDILMRLADALGVDYDTLALASGVVQTRQAAAALRAYHRRAQRDRDRLDEMHGQLDDHLLKLTASQFQHVLQTAAMWAEAAEIRSQAADPAPPRTSPQSPPAGPAPASPDPAAPESAGSGCGR